MFCFDVWPLAVRSRPTLPALQLEAGAVELNEVEELFELPISKFNEMAQCRAQLRVLKLLWDFKGLVLATYDAWKTSLWAEINTGEPSCTLRACI